MDTRPQNVKSPGLLGEKPGDGYNRERMAAPGDFLASTPQMQPALDAEFTAALLAADWHLKYKRIAASFLSGRSWHAIEAVRELGTTCLHTDVADLEARGLAFSRERITVPGYGGSKTSVVRYRLRPDSYAQACALLGLAAPLGLPGDGSLNYLSASGG